MSAPRIILASTSRYRADLLRRLLPHFEQVAPGIEEAYLKNESPGNRAQRLARTKARAVTDGLRDAVVIGSDQVAELDGRVLDKPGDVATARIQLAASSGRSVHFHTALCVIDTRVQPITEYMASDATTVRFRELGEAEIARYVEREQPLDCAGSFKCEALGISLFEAIDSHDPTALVGLPLIALARFLRECGLDAP
ncbi:MAG: Maf family protein [Acidihalobacter sp.]